MPPGRRPPVPRASGGNQRLERPAPAADVFDLHRECFRLPLQRLESRLRLGLPLLMRRQPVPEVDGERPRREHPIAGAERLRLPADLDLDACQPIREVVPMFRDRRTSASQLGHLRPDAPLRLAPLPAAHDVGTGVLRFAQKSATKTLPLLGETEAGERTVGRLLGIADEAHGQERRHLGELGQHPFERAEDRPDIEDAPAVVGRLAQCPGDQGRSRSIAGPTSPEAKIGSRLQPDQGRPGRIRGPLDGDDRQCGGLTGDELAEQAGLYGCFPETRVTKGRELVEREESLTIGEGKHLGARAGRGAAEPLLPCDERRGRGRFDRAAYGRQGRPTPGRRQRTRLHRRVSSMVAIQLGKGTILRIERCYRRSQTWT